MHCVVLSIESACSWYCPPLLLLYPSTDQTRATPSAILFCCKTAACPAAHLYEVKGLHLCRHRLQYSRTWLQVQVSCGGHALRGGAGDADEAQRLLEMLSSFQVACGGHMSRVGAGSDNEAQRLFGATRS